jgi:flagellar biosynthesis protein FlhB
MAERRPFPPSARRVALARQAGLTAASPIVVGAVACAGAIAVGVVLGRAAVAMIGGWIADACAGRATLTPDRLLGGILEIALPVVGAAAIVAIVAQVAQTRALWLPHRKIPDAPSVDPRTVTRTSMDLGSTIVIGVIAFGWLWTMAPRIARLVTAPVASGAWLVASFFVALAIAWITIGTIDALLRRAELTGVLAMTREEKREDDRLASADPRWRARRAAIARGPSIQDAVARAACVVLGDDLAIAIAWNATRQPIPLRTVSARGARATQILGLARRHRIPVHRDPELAAALVDGEGPIPDRWWSRVAALVAARSV